MHRGSKMDVLPGMDIEFQSICGYHEKNAKNSQNVSKFTAVFLEILIIKLTAVLKIKKVHKLPGVYGFQNL